MVICNKVHKLQNMNYIVNIISLCLLVPPCPICSRLFVPMPVCVPVPEIALLYEVFFMRSSFGKNILYGI